MIPDPIVKNIGYTHTDVQIECEISVVGKTYRLHTRGYSPAYSTLFSPLL